MRNKELVDGYQNIGLLEKEKHALWSGIEEQAKAGQGEHTGVEKVRRIQKSRILPAVAAVFVLLSISITAGAATSQTINDWMYQVNPALAEKLYPINETSLDQDILLEVTGAANTDEEADVYFSVTDLAEGESRVNEALDFCDSCSIDGPNAFGIEFVSYDVNQKKANYVLHCGQGKNLANRMTTFSIGQLMLDKTQLEGFDTGVDLAETLTAQTGDTGISIQKYGYTGGEELPKEDMKILTPDVMQLTFLENSDQIYITNIGIVDGKLHVQTRWEESFDNHGWFSLNAGEDSSQETKDLIQALNETGVHNYYFNTEADEAATGDGLFTHHIEYVFDSEGIQDWKNVKLLADVTLDGSFVEGDWEVNFRMADLE